MTQPPSPFKGGYTTVNNKKIRSYPFKRLNKQKNARILPIIFLLFEARHDCNPAQRTNH